MWISGQCALSNPVHAGHADIHEDDIGRFLLGMETFDESHGSLAIAGSLHDFKIRFHLKQLAQALANQCLIVGNHDTNWFHQTASPSPDAIPPTPDAINRVATI